MKRYEHTENPLRIKEIIRKEYPDLAYRIEKSRKYKTFKEKHPF